MKKIITVFIFGLTIIGLMIYTLFFSQKNHIECEIKELQKLLYEPSFSDRQNIGLYCELKFPYEKKIYGPKISEWHGQLITVRNDSDAYRITKVKIYAQKGNCNEGLLDVKEFIYHIADGTTGGSFDWSEEYNCYFPDKTEFWGKIRKEAFNNP